MMIRIARSSSRGLAEVAWRATLLAAALAAGAAHAQVVFNASGATAGDVTGQVNAFRSSLGTLNANVGGSFGSGRREINWDGVPDAFSAPNNLPANFFNVNSPRGVVFSTPGSGFQVSANAVNPTSTPIEFGNLNPAYPDVFAAFSAQRLFTAIGSTIVDVSFFVPGSTTAALTRGFGAIFTDVDSSTSSSISFFDASNNLLNTYAVPAITGDQTFSFLGVDFGSAVVSHVRITSGNQALGPGTTGDVVAMDDFIYGEPIAAVPEPEVQALMLAGLGLLAAVVRRRAARKPQR